MTESTNETRRAVLSPCVARTAVMAAAMAAALAGCGGGAGSDGAAATGGGRAQVQAAAAPTTLAVQLDQTAADPLLQGLTIPANAATAGMWSPTQAWPLNGIHAELLPDGRVLTHGTPQSVPGTQDGRTYDFWTPALGFGTGSHATTYDAARPVSFCSTAAFLGDGRLVLTGGNSPVNSALVTWSNSTWVTDPSALADQRWYSTMLTLPDGRLIIVGGMDPYNEGMINTPDAAIASGLVSMTPEIYTAGTGWRTLTGATSRDAWGPDFLRNSYPHAWIAPDGRVFGISADNMWYLDPAGNGGTGLVSLPGKFKTPSTTAPVNAGASSSAVMYAPGKILQVGGNGSFNGDGYPASNLATLVDINGAAPVVKETAPMSVARRYVNTVVLPNGKVVATGGTRIGNNGGADAVYTAEIWDPATGTWTVGASAAQIRVYHSSTLLLPNGTVLSVGGGAPGPVDNQNAEIYYPPYLFATVNGTAQLAARPQARGISALNFAFGAALQLQMSDATALSRLVLVRNGSVTHSFNGGQRFLELTFTQSGDTLTATMPGSGALAPPGYYELFVLNAAGVPSAGIGVSLGLSTTSQTLLGLPRNQPAAFENLASRGQVIGTDATGLGVLAAAANPAAAPLADQYLLRNGLADNACVSFESAATPGNWLRHQNYRLRLNPSDGTALFNSDATFCPEGGMAGTGVTFRSSNFPGYVLRARNGELWIDPQAADAAFAQSATFLPATISSLPAIGSQNAPPLASGATASYAPGLDAAGLTFSWNFGDGSAATAYSASSAVSHAYTAPGDYVVTLTVRSVSGATTSKTFIQAVYAAPTAVAPRASSQMLLEPRSGASTRLWVVNPDNDSVSVIDTATNARVAEIATGGSAPRTLARAADGSVWVVNRDSATISVIATGTLTVTRTIALPRASQPFGLVFAPAGNAYVSLQALGQVLKLDGTSGATVAATSVGSNPRHVSVTGDSARLLVSRFITPTLPGEATAAVQTTVNGVPVGGEVVVLNTATMTTTATVELQHSDKTDTEIQGSGVPNYLGAAVVSPDGTTAWVPSKQDNVKRGTLRNGLSLNFQNSVRAISSRIDLARQAEVYAARIDHDNASLASAAAYDPTGAYLFVALETARQVEVVNAIGGGALFRIEVGIAPQGLTVSADGTRLYVHNFMDRSVSVVDMTPLMRNGELRSVPVATVATVATDKLAATVLAGKRLFYDARDTRLARDAYMSCASCHNDGADDGRVWDFTGFGEGLRNTIALRGRAGMGQGNLHWSANFDEIQDFEGQIRNFAGGTGLMTDAQFNTGTRNQPLGDSKAGVSADLDALAAYVTSLSTFAPSPWRNADGTLGAAAVAGKTVFQTQNCASCHAGPTLTDSAGGSQLRNIGTLKPSSGSRLGAALSGIDVPTLRDAWATAPYLHDGSAPTLAAAVSAHKGVTLAATDLANLAEYVREIGSDEVQPIAPPATAVSCAAENATCVLPAGATVDVYYGAAGKFAVRYGVSGSIACNNATFGDPNAGVVKACTYVVTNAALPASGTGLLGAYYASDSLLGNVVLQRTEAVNFNWGTAAPAATVPADNFSVRWTGAIEAPASGTYVLQTNSDDGVRLWLNGQLLISNWTAHGPTLNTSAAVTLVAGQRYGIVIEYQERAGGAVMQLLWQTPGSASFVVVPVERLYTQSPAGGGAGLKGQYFATNNLTGNVVLQRSEAVNFNWGTGAPDPSVPADNFSVRWSGMIEPAASGSYVLQTNSDDGIRVWLNGVQVINNWTVHSPTLNSSAAVTLAANQRYSIVVEYQEFGGGAVAQLLWKGPLDSAFVVVPANRLYWP